MNRFWRSFSAAAKNSSSSISDGITPAEEELTSVCLAIDSCRSPDSAWFSLDGDVFLLRNLEIRDKVNREREREILVADRFGSHTVHWNFELKRELNKVSLH